jgi:hypothetical protein
MNRKTIPTPILWTLVAIVSLSTGVDRVAAQTVMPNQQGRLPKQDRQRLALAVAKGETSVRLLIASMPGQNQKLAAEIKTIGGTVEYEADEVDYLRVKVPLAAVDQIQRLAEIQAICINGSSIYENQESDSGGTGAGGASDDQDVPAPPGKEVPADNPYVAMRDMGAPQFTRKHPTFDGRGVTIGVVEAAPDLLVPELQTA